MLGEFLIVRRRGRGWNGFGCIKTETTRQSRVVLRAVILHWSPLSEDLGDLRSYPFDVPPLHKQADFHQRRVGTRSTVLQAAFGLLVGKDGCSAYSGADSVGSLVVCRRSLKGPFKVVAKKGRLPLMVRGGKLSYSHFRTPRRLLYPTGRVSGPGLIIA